MRCSVLRRAPQAKTGPQVPDIVHMIAPPPTEGGDPVAAARLSKGSRASTCRSAASHYDCCMPLSLICVLFRVSCTTEFLDKCNTAFNTYARMNPSRSIQSAIDATLCSRLKRHLKPRKQKPPKTLWFGTPSGAGAVSRGAGKRARSSGLQRMGWIVAKTHAMGWLHRMGLG